MRPVSRPHRFDPRLLFPDIEADGPGLSRTWDNPPPAPDGEDVDMSSLGEIDDVIDLLWSGECRDCPLCRAYAAPGRPAESPGSPP